MRLLLCKTLRILFCSPEWRNVETTFQRQSQVSLKKIFPTSQATNLGTKRKYSFTRSHVYVLQEPMIYKTRQGVTGFCSVIG